MSSRALVGTDATVKKKKVTMVVEQSESQSGISETHDAEDSPIIHNQGPISIDVPHKFNQAKLKRGLKSSDNV